MLVVVVVAVVVGLAAVVVLGVVGVGLLRRADRLGAEVEATAGAARRVSTDLRELQRLLEQRRVLAAEQSREAAEAGRTWDATPGEGLAEQRRLARRRRDRRGRPGLSAADLPGRVLRA